MFRPWGFVLFLLLIPALHAQDAPVLETWALVRQQGQTIGTQHEQVVARPSSKYGLRYMTTSDQVLKIKRIDQDVTLHLASRVFEGADGVVIDFDKTIEEGGSPVITRGYREGGDLVVWERGQSERFDLPKIALGPYAAELKRAAMPLNAGVALDCLVFDEDFLEHPVYVHREVIGKEKRATLHGDQDLWKIKVTMDAMPGMESSEWVDDQGQIIVSTQRLAGIGELEIFTCTKAEAQQPLQSGDLGNAGTIIPDKPLTNYHGLIEANYHLSGPDQITLYSGPEQSVVTEPDGSVDVKVTLPVYDEEDIKWTVPAVMTAELKPYLLSSTYLELSDPGLQELAVQAVGAESNPLRVAQKIESFVRLYIVHKDLSVGFASAADTVKSRTGDCTEHAVLCAALGREVGLPTRLVFGLAYLPSADSDANNPNGGFGFHMWAEAYLGPDRWVAMDSALDGFDVGHIACVKTDLGSSADVQSTLLLPITQLIGKLKIEVRETK